MYNYSQERTPTNQSTNEKPNLFKRPEKHTDEYSLAGDGLDEPGGSTDYFYQKESFDNFYDTIKNEISPQKINDFNKLVVDFNGYINKLSIENSRLKNKLIKAQERIRSNEKKLIYHDKTRKRIEVNIHRKLEFEKELIKSKEILEKENQQLKKNLNEAKMAYMKLKQNIDKRLKETLKRNFLEWQNHEKQNMLKLKNCMEKEITERVSLEKQDIEERYKLQIENIRTNLIRKEQKMKSFFEERFRQEIKMVEKKLAEQFDYEKQLMKRDLINQLNDYKKELEIKAARDKRNDRQLLIENYEDTVMVKERLIKQFQKEQGDMLRKIKAIKQEFESNNYQTLTTVNSFSEDQNQFMNDIAQKLTYSKMNLGFTSNDTLLTNNPIYQEPSLGDEFYSWINESSLQNGSEKDHKKNCSSKDSISSKKKKPPQQGSAKNHDKIGNIVDKENLRPGNLLGEAGNFFAGDDEDQDLNKLNSQSGNAKHHIKIEELQELSLGPLKDSDSGKIDDICQTERYILRAPKERGNHGHSKEDGSDIESIFHNKDNMSTVKSKEENSLCKELEQQQVGSFINLMKQNTDCNTVTKDTDLGKGGGTNEWSECWVKVERPEHNKIMKSAADISIQPHGEEMMTKPSFELSVSNSQLSMKFKHLDLKKEREQKEGKSSHGCSQSDRRSLIDNDEDENNKTESKRQPSLRDEDKTSENNHEDEDDINNLENDVVKCTPTERSKQEEEDAQLSPSKLFEKRVEEGEKTFDQHLKSLENKYHSLIKERDQEIYKISKRHQKSEGICIEENAKDLDIFKNIKEVNQGSDNTEENSASKETVSDGDHTSVQFKKGNSNLVHAIKMEFNDCDLVVKRK